MNLTNKVNLLVTIAATVTVLLLMICSAIPSIYTYKMTVPDKSAVIDVCTQSVDAMVETITANDDGTYTPEYSFTYNNTVYSTTGATLDAAPKFSVGDSKQIFIEPTNPYHVYDPDYDPVRIRQRKLIINLSIRGAIALAVIIAAVIAALRLRKNEESGGN